MPSRYHGRAVSTMKKARPRQGARRTADRLTVPIRITLLGPPPGVDFCIQGRDAQALLQRTRAEGRSLSFDVTVPRPELGALRAFSAKWSRASRRADSSASARGPLRARRSPAGRGAPSPAHRHDLGARRARPLRLPRQPPPSSQAVSIQGRNAWPDAGVGPFRRAFTDRTRTGVCAPTRTSRPDLCDRQ
jgi:hypothetical protein